MYKAKKKIYPCQKKKSLEQPSNGRQNVLTSVMQAI